MNGPDRRRALAEARRTAPPEGWRPGGGSRREPSGHRPGCSAPEGGGSEHRGDPGGAILLGVEERGVMKTVVTRHDEDREMEGAPYHGR